MRSQVVARIRTVVSAGAGAPLEPCSRAGPLFLALPSHSAFPPAALRRLRLPALAAGLLLALALLPYRFTDGDSCLYAALAHEMAAEGAWVAPTWAFEGKRACFHEHPPGGYWAAAALEGLGLGDAAAARVANAAALLALVAAVWWLAGPGAAAGGLGPLTAALLLLHYPLWKYALRFGLELPFAACAVACFAAARRPGRGGAALAGLALAGAFLTRGAFGFAVPPLLLLDALRDGASLRAVARRMAAIGAAALVPLLLFDLAHAASTGHSFWLAYLEKQVLPSLAADGTPHANRGPTWLYYGGRLLLYTQPWTLLAAALLLRAQRTLRGSGRRPASLALALAPDRRLAAAWIAIFFVGIALAHREGSRYLVVAYPASAWLAAIALRGAWLRAGAAARRRVATAALFLPALLVGAKHLTTPADAWWRSAGALREAREVLAGEVVFGPFAAHDDRAKQFLRHHGAIPAYSGAAPPGALSWQAAAEPAPPGREVVLETELFRLLR